MKTLNLICLALGFTGFSAAAQAQVIVLGEGDAGRCYNHTLRGNPGSKAAIKTCSKALANTLSRKNRTATFVNRGILHMRSGDQILASKDFETAIALNDDLTEAYVNYGASLIYQDNYDEALNKLNIALQDSDSWTRPEALINRAIIFDHQKNYKAAYFDLKEALALRPEWDPALTMISRYEVRKAG